MERSSEATIEKTGLGSSVGHSLRWSYGTVAANFVLQFIIAASLARLLDPAAYGMIAIANTVVRCLQNVTDLGISSTVIQKAEFRRNDDAALLFVLACGANLLLMAVVWAAAPWLLSMVPNASTSPATMMVLRVMSLGALFTGMAQVASGLMGRDLDFRRLGLYGMAGLLVGQCGVAIPLAALGLGVWSLVAGSLVQVATVSLLTLLRVRHPLWPRRLHQGVGALLGLGSRYFAVRLLDAISLYIPPFAVATLAGLTAAGLYDRAFILACMPINVLIHGLSRVLFATFSRLQHQPTRLPGAYLSVLMLGVCLLAPLSAGMAVAAPELIQTMLGGTWTAAAGPFAWLSLWALLRSFIHYPAAICEACGRLRQRIGQELVYLAAMIAGLVLVRPSDAVGVLQVVTAVELLNVVALHVIVGQFLQVRFYAVVECFAVAVPPTVVVGGGIALMLRALGPHVPMPLALLAAMATGGILLGLSLALHPSRHLRHEVGTRVMGDMLGVSVETPGWLGRLRRFLG
ncbi:MAG TPA: oligosaccharide flippase family protein [Patescibacteria group bacterium]|nr:oligosaccharide flippase family protein [Patescibacteria group bacterium]